MPTHELELKEVGAFEIKDADKGEVQAIVATLGVVDRDGDVILPGSIPDGAKVKLSGYSHDVVLDGAAPVGKGTISEENGKAVFRGSFFMSTERGREAFLTTKELGPEGEWSFGFPKSHTEVGKLTEEWKAKGAHRVITKLLPIEASPVFVGAGIGTGTVAVKEADSAAPIEEAAPDPPAPDPEVEAKRLAAEAEAKERLQAEIDEGVERFQRTRRLFNL